MLSSTRVPREFDWIQQFKTTFHFVPLSWLLGLLKSYFSTLFGSTQQCIHKVFCSCLSLSNLSHFKILVTTCKCAEDFKRREKYLFPRDASCLLHFPSAALTFSLFVSLYRCLRVLINGSWKCVAPFKLFSSFTSLRSSHFLPLNVFRMCECFVHLYSTLRGKVENVFM